MAHEIQTVNPHLISTYFSSIGTSDFEKVVRQLFAVDYRLKCSRDDKEDEFI